MYFTRRAGVESKIYLKVPTMVNYCNWKTFLDIFNRFYTLKRSFGD
jgi:hypothetical protein